MKKAIGMFAALIVALGMTGVAFAHWSEILYINGTVNTGDVNLEFSDWDYFIDQDKPVADVEIIPHDLDGDGDIDKLEINASNLYPCCWINIWFVIHNNGTIPVNLVDYELLTPVSDPDNLADFIYEEIYIVEAPPYFPQLDPCDVLIIDKWIHVEQTNGNGENCPENATMTYEAYLVFDQWNTL
jgi:hypothetical protein